MFGQLETNQNTLLTREEYVARVLRESIFKGELKPGDRLDQREIARQLDVSRTPVRNALLILSEEGLVDMTAHRSAVVAELSYEELEELYLIRSVLEGIAARLAATRMTAEQLAKIRTAWEAMDQAADPEEWVELNNRFHYLIYEAAHRPRLLALIENLRDTTRPYSRQFMGSDEYVRIVRDQHEQIVQALASGDEQQAQQAVEKHLNAVCQSMIESFSQKNPNG
jgi:DNA-binding GntR family transcriptional regulator